MKFKKITSSRVKNLDLVLNGIMKPEDVLIKGDIIEIPDSNTTLIESMKINGNYEEYKEFKKPKKEKKTKKEDE